MKRMQIPLAVVLALILPLSAHAHCGPNEQCRYDPFHHGPDTPEAQTARNAAAMTSRIAEPAVKEAVRELVIPKVPQLNLPLGGAAKPPANAPAPLGKTEVREVSPSPPGNARPLPPALQASAIAREVAPKVYTEIFAASREIDNARALEALQKKDPRLANSAYLTERRQIKLGETFEQLKRIDARAQQAINGLEKENRRPDLRDSLSRASLLIQSLGSGDIPAERKP